MRKFISILACALLCCSSLVSCMSQKFLDNADYDDIAGVYDSISFRLWKDKDKSNALIYLIKNRRTDEALFLIENDVFKLDYANNRKENALSESIKTENSDVIIALMEHGAPISNSGIENPVFIAVRTGNPTIIDTLIKNGAKLDSLDKDGNNALHYVAFSKNTSAIVEYLLQKNIPLEHKNSRGETPLYYAIKNANTTAAEILIGKGADTDTADIKNQNIYFAAVESGSVVTLDFVSGHNGVVDIVSTENKTPLLLAIEQNKPEMVESLLYHKADIERETTTDMFPLWFAFRKSDGSDTRCLKVLAENGANTARKSSSGETALVRSILDGNDSLAKFFIVWQGGIDIADSTGNFPVQYAVQKKNYAVLSDLIAADANLGVRSKNGSTLLHTCVELGDKQMLDMLLDSKRIDVDYAGSSGTTAAMLAFQRGNPDLGNHLINRGANVYASDSSGRTLAAYRKTYYQNQITVANNKIAANNSTISSLQSSNSIAQGKIASLRIERDAADARYEEAKEECDRLKSRVDRIESEVRHAKSQMDYWDSRVTYWTNEYNAATSSTVRNTCASGLSTARSAYNSERNTYNSKNSEYIRMSGEYLGKSIALIALLNAYNSVVKKIKEQENIISSNNSTINRLSSENSTLSGNIKIYEREANRY